MEQLLESLVTSTQERLKKDFGFSEVYIPLEATANDTLKCSIFTSASWEKASKLLIIIASGRGIAPGIWSRSLLLESSSSSNTNSDSGTMIPYITYALQQGYGIWILNPNVNSINKVPIPHSSSPEEHVSYVWNALGKTSAHVFIVAYGRGGDLAKHLISTNEQSFLHNHIAAIAFIESSHRISTSSDSEAVRTLIGTRAINWQRSSTPAGTQLPDCERLGCLSLSAGCSTTSSNTAWTIGASIDTVFAFFNSAISNNTSSNVQISNSMSVNDFDLLSVIGKGAYGKVFLAKKKNSDKVYAMKVLKKSDVFSKHQVEHTKSEQRILKNIAHPFIVRLRYAFQSNAKLYLVMDYYNGGSLFVHLRRDKRFYEGRAKFYAAQLISAIAHLHSLHILYRDLKLENILMDSDGNIAITDFGLSKEDDEGTTFVGTPEYLGPELLSHAASKSNRSCYGSSVDLWSYGVLVYEMIYGVTPFFDKNRRTMFSNILTKDPVFDEHPNVFVSNDCKDFLSSLLIKNPRKRLGCKENIGVSEVFNHKWFAGVDWNALNAKAITAPYIPSFSGDASASASTSYVPSVFTSEAITGSANNNNASRMMAVSNNTPGSSHLASKMHFDNFSYMGSSAG